MNQNIPAEVQKAMRETMPDGVVHPVIIKYWREVLAPKYGYTELLDAKTGKLVAKVKACQPIRGGA
jgi:hypothetical protein